MRRVRLLVAGVMPRALVIATLAVAMAGCSLKATFLPVEGPLSQMTPVPMITAKATGVSGNTGGLSFAMPDGERCQGRWSSAGGSGGVTVTSATLMSQYGATYLSGMSLGGNGGENRGMGIATCDKGRSFQIDFVSRGHGFGIAKDNQGNVYRFVF